MKTAQSVVVLIALVLVDAASAHAQAKPPVGAVMPMAAGASAWVASQGGAIPPGASPAGYESGGFLYACRAEVEGVHPGKVRPGFNGCYVPAGGREQSIRQYEVLVGAASWEIAREGNVPEGAVEVGRTRTGQPLYTCRAAGAAGQLQIGETGAGLRGCSIGVGGLVQTQGNYEVLVQR